VISGCNDDTMWIWDLATGRLVRTLYGQGQAHAHVAVTPDSHQMVTRRTASDDKVRVWELASG
jgi:WD40 repeat protein